MQATYKINDLLSISVESETLKDLIDTITQIDDSIRQEPCGKCESLDTFPQSRKVGDDTFYEIKCRKCGAILQLGINKSNQSLYKKRMLTDNKGKALKENDKAIYLPNHGWRKWNFETKQME